MFFCWCVGCGCESQCAVNMRFENLPLFGQGAYNVGLRIVGPIDNIGIFWAFHSKNCLWF
jgi:hypothetical protein